MKYRILKNGKKFRLEQQVLLFFWYTLKHCVSGGMYPIFCPNCYKTEIEAEDHAQKLWGSEGKRVRKFIQT